jgi:molybdopterin-guanine dinucleotide biosynthesis protein A
MPVTQAPLGVLLAGGRARRMGGGDKALREIGGQTILQRVIGRIAPQCDGVILNANGDPSRFVNFGLPIVKDDIEEFAGPLAGVLAALDWASVNRPNIAWVLSVPTDTPFLPHDLAARLQQGQIAEGAQLASAASGGRMHPVIGLWSVALRDELRDALVKEELRKVSDWISRYRTATATWAIEPYDPFFNINTLEDADIAERLALRVG